MTDLRSSDPMWQDSSSANSPLAVAHAIGGLLLAGDWKAAGQLLLEAKQARLYAAEGTTWRLWLCEIPISRMHAHRLIQVAQYGTPEETASFNQAYAEVRRVTRRVTPRVMPVVYFIRAEVGGPIKIGSSAEPKQRLAEFQIGSPLRLMIVATMDGGREEERILHRRFAAYRLHGEWFRPCAGLLKLIRDCRDAPIPETAESTTRKVEMAASSNTWTTPAT